jgi:hypothetical protein
VSIDLGRLLIAAQLVAPEEVEAALFLSVVRGVSFVRALVDRGAVGERVLEQELGRRGGLVLRQVVGHPELFGRLPAAMCRRLGAVPTRLDSMTGTVDVAAADPLDPHVSIEMGFHLGAPVRVVMAPLGAIEEAIRRLELDQPRPEPAVETRSRRTTPVFPHGAPSSVPPPGDDVPIPLVRRLGVPLIDDPQTIEAETHRLSADEPVIDLKRSKVVSSRRPLESIEPAHEAATTTSTLATPSSAAPTNRIEPPRPAVVRDEVAKARSGDRADRPPVIREPAVEPPSVSFPSSPPPAAEQESEAAPRSTGPTTPRRGGMGVVAAPVVEVPAIAPRPITVPAPSARPLPPPVEIAEEATEISPPPRARQSEPAVLMIRLREARSRDEVVKRTLEALGPIAERAALFAVKKDAFVGWAASGLPSADAVKDVSIAHDVPSILATGAAAGSYLGPIPDNAAHAKLRRALGRPPGEVAVTTVKVAGRPAMMILCAGIEDAPSAARSMGEVAQAAAAALTRLLRGA